MKTVRLLLKRVVGIGAGVLAVVLLTVGSAVFAQAPAAANADSGKTGSPTPAPSPVPVTPEEARRARLVADTARLYQLAQELKAEVDKSSKDTLSLAVIKKASEVEKLAADLKERMKSEAPKAK